MKILHIIEGVDANLGGLPYALFNILATEKMIGLHSEVLSIVPPPGTFDEISFEYPCYLFSASFPSRFKRSQSAMQWLETHIQEFDCLIIHSLWNLLSIESAFIAAKHQKPYVIWPHGSLDPFDLQKKYFLKKAIGPLVIKRVLKKASFVCCTTSLEAELLECYGSNPKVQVLPLAIEKIHEEGQRSRFRQTYNFEENDTILLFLSRINYKKGLDILLQALKLLQKRNPANHQRIKLAIAGSGSEEYTLYIKTLVNQLDLTSIVTFCGLLSGEAKADAFAGSDCFVLPSMNENFGIAVVESLQAGLPVLISKNVYIWQEIITQQGGWVCDYSVDSVYKQLVYVLDHPQDLILIKSQAQIIGDQFKPQSLSPAYFGFYQSIKRQ